MGTHTLSALCGDTGLFYEYCYNMKELPELYMFGVECVLAVCMLLLWLLLL